MKDFLNKIVKHFRKESSMETIQYKVKDKVMCILIADDENYLIKAEIWKITEHGYLVIDLNNILHNDPNKLWFINSDDVIEII